MTAQLTGTGVTFPDGSTQSSAASPLSTILYDDRDTLRTTVPGANLTSIAVQDLGIFTYYANNTEPDDDDTCFVVSGSGGAWRLLTPTLDTIIAWQAPEMEYLLARRMTGYSCFCQGISCIQVGATSIISACLPGANPNDFVMASPIGWTKCCTCSTNYPSYFATIPCPNCVWVYLSNTFAGGCISCSYYLYGVPCSLSIVASTGSPITPFCGPTTMWKAVSFRTDI